MDRQLEIGMGPLGPGTAVLKVVSEALLPAVEIDRGHALAGHADPLSDTAPEGRPRYVDAPPSQSRLVTLSDPGKPRVRLREAERD